MSDFEVVSKFDVTGDQPKAIDDLCRGIDSNYDYQTLLGVTGSGKTFTMAKVIERLQRPALVIAHNKTLVAQLYEEFREFFPNNAVEYFVSYYDYYQPEAYIPRTDTFIEKDSSINKEIDRMRHSATRALFSRRDVLIVASVSCIYGLGEPEEYYRAIANVKKGEKRSLRNLINALIAMQYERNDYDLNRGTFRVRGDTVDIIPSYDDSVLRISMFGDEIDDISHVDYVTGEIIEKFDSLEIYPAKHFVTSKEKTQLAISSIENELTSRLEELKSSGKILEAARLEQRTLFDLEMMRQVGYCSGIENYSRHLSGRGVGSTPWTLMHYLAEDVLIFVDESHMTIPQIRGMYQGDMSRKNTLVQHGFRLPSALDNRPLNFNEFESLNNQTIYVSATPGPYELGQSKQITEQIIRPTGLIDPGIIVRPTFGQIDDLLAELRSRIDIGQRTLITTLTKRMAEELSEYLVESNIRACYLHSDINTFERNGILRDLRLGVFDVVVGINLLREGLDLPEVSLVVILDADKEGYLRSNTALIQMIGRAARHENGLVIMYADNKTASMDKAIFETNRRRLIQENHNVKYGITPVGIKKEVRDTGIYKLSVLSNDDTVVDYAGMPRNVLIKVSKSMQKEMKQAAEKLDFEQAAQLRDQIGKIRSYIEKIKS
jgi:excinuclease ABC subunit B